MAIIFAPALTHREGTETAPLAIAIVNKLFQLQLELLHVPPTIVAARELLDEAAAQSIVDVRLQPTAMVPVLRVTACACLHDRTNVPPSHA